MANIIGDLVDPGVVPQRREDAAREADQQREHQRIGRQRQRHRQALHRRLTPPAGPAAGSGRDRPAAVRAYQRSSCTVNGWSRPRSWPDAARSAPAWRSVPAITAAGSPGISCIIPKVIRLTMSRIGSALPRTRRRTTTRQLMFLHRRQFANHTLDMRGMRNGMKPFTFGPRRLHLGQRAERHGVDLLERDASASRANAAWRSSGSAGCSCRSTPPAVPGSSLPSFGLVDGARRR